jgi:hypothetical protein
MKDIYTGNTINEAQTTNQRGWFIGHFMIDRLPKTREVEVKWGMHPANDEKTSCGVNTTATTLSILIEGLFVLNFPDLGHCVQLEKQGDYVIWMPGVAHTWKALKPSTILTVRWPSISDDQTHISSTASY